MNILLAIPAYNEEKCLEGTIERLVRVVSQDLPSCTVTMVIVDNGSTDNTASIARILARTHPQVEFLSLPERGKGAAIKAAWSKDADLYMFTDADLAYRPVILKEMYAAFLGGADVAVASRKKAGAQVTRSAGRLLATEVYNRLLRMLFGNTFTDAQAGCKGITLRVRNDLLPRVNEKKWFFDTLLLLEAEKRGYTIREIPAEYVDVRWGLSFLPTSLYFIGKLISLRIRWAFRSESRVNSTELDSNPRLV